MCDIDVTGEAYLCTLFQRYVQYSPEPNQQQVSVQLIANQRSDARRKREKGMETSIFIVRWSIDPSAQPGAAEGEIRECDSSSSLPRKQNYYHVTMKGMLRQTLK